MRALITGGAGFIGSHLSEKLIKLGHRVTIIDDLSTGRMENINHLTGHENFTFAIENILNETVMDRLIYECDIIFHLAASVGVELIVSHPVAVIETNILGTEMVLKIANRYKQIRCFTLVDDTIEYLVLLSGIPEADAGAPVERRKFYFDGSQVEIVA